MPLIKRGPGRRNSTESAGARGADDDVYITDSSETQSWMDDDESVYSDATATAGDAEPDPPRPRVQSYAPSRPESNYGQFLVPGNTNDPQWQSRFSQRFQSSSQGQERTQRYPPNSYPSQRIRYAAATGMGQNNSSRYRRESAGSYRRPTTTGDPSSSTYPLPGYSSNGYPTVSQSFSESNRYYDTAPPEPTRPPRPPPRPLTPPAEVPTPTPRTDPAIRRLETELAAFRAREEERRAKDERKRLEENIRQESEAVIQQMKQQLEKAEQEKAAQVEQARAQGKQDAQNRFYQERLAEQEKQQEREELRKQIEMDVRAELEAEREAEMAEREARERLSQEIQKTAMDSMLERLEEALALSKEKLLQDTEMDKDLLLAEVQTSITSHLRQSLVVSGPRQEHGHASSSRAESRSKSRPQSSLHHVECTSVADTSCVRPQSPSSQGDSETDDKELPPPAPDVPRAACDSEEEEEDMTDHPGYSQGGWGFMPGYKPQRDSRIQDGRDMDSDYQTREKLPFMALVDRVADALMDRFGIRPKWRAPGHTTPDDSESGQRYGAMKRRSIDNDTYSDLSDEELPYSDESAVHGDVRDWRLEHEEPNHISHPHEPPHLYAQPIEGIRDTSQPSSGASLDPLPFSIADDPNMSVVDDVETQPDDTLQKLLEANNSIGRDTSSDSDVASIAGSDSTIFHEAPESLTDYSTVSNDYTKGSFDEDRFGSEMSSMGDMKQLVKFNGDVVDE